MVADPKKAKEQEAFNEMMDEYFKTKGKDTIGQMVKELFKEDESEGWFSKFLKN